MSDFNEVSSAFKKEGSIDALSIAGYNFHFPGQFELLE